MSTEVIVECLCGRMYAVDSAQVGEFKCDTCQRVLEAPSVELDKVLRELRKRFNEGLPPQRLACVREAAQMRNEHTLPLLQKATQTGVREVVNAALVGAASFEGPGRELLFRWVSDGILGVTRLISAFKEENWAPGVDFLCEAIETGRFKENQAAECAPYLGESQSPRAVATLRALRRTYPNLSGLFDTALARLRNVDESATDIPEEAKAIPGRPSAAHSQAAPRKGCMGVLLLLCALLACMAWALKGLNLVA